MTTTGFIVPPLSRRTIRRYANLVRQTYGCDQPKLDVMHLIEFWLPVADEGFVMVPVARSELGDAHGFTLPHKKMIQLREDVYFGALDGKGRDRMTVAHELGHYVLHRQVTFARVPPGGEVPAFRNSEWQANTFAAELCWRRPNFDRPCRLNIDQGSEAGREAVGCG